MQCSFPGVLLFASSARVWQQRSAGGYGPALESCLGLRRLVQHATELPRDRRVGPDRSSCAGSPQGRSWLPLSNRVAVCGATLCRI
jgi:hypothetical protein